MKFKIKNDEIKIYNESHRADFPKYITQLLNLANQNAQGTRPKTVGQLSELFSEFVSSGEEVTIKSWERWYGVRYPGAVTKAADKIYKQIKQLRNAVDLIDLKITEKWVKDLIIDKTFNGLYIQKAILASLAERLHTDYRLALPSEELKGADGYVGGIPYSIKPDTYKSMERLGESIDVTMIYYTKTKDGVIIEIEE